MTRTSEFESYLRGKSHPRFLEIIAENKYSRSTAVIPYELKDDQIALFKKAKMKVISVKDYYQYS